MPKIGNTINYIMSELYEQEREDTYRIKKVKDLRQAAVELEKLEKMVCMYVCVCAVRV